MKKGNQWSISQKPCLNNSKIKSLKLTMAEVKMRVPKSFHLQIRIIVLV